ncbi:hypothetical protein D3874_03250 [Oleomonas cavernae]|uniref:Uncharacterized protein n=2 Tax=Oleomonas cavernae TaxID=2320859 RepID=A0A418WUD1_9PROT|nr:hypothetical protein D3874_03250 [Oleomonas cavernae]
MAVSPSSVDFISVKQTADDRWALGRDLLYEITFDASNRMGVPLRAIATCKAALYDDGQVKVYVTKMVDHQGNPI